MQIYGNHWTGSLLMAIFRTVGTSPYKSRYFNDFVEHFSKRGGRIGSHISFTVSDHSIVFHLNGRKGPIGSIHYN